MNWLVMLIAFSLAVAMGAWLASLLARSRPRWSDRRRLVVAASILPGFALLATLVGIGWVIAIGPGTGENMRDLAIAVTAGVGGFFAILAFVGGFIGASLAQPRK